MGKNVTKFYVTNWEGRVGLDPNMYDVTLLDLFFELFPGGSMRFRYNLSLPHKLCISRVTKGLKMLTATVVNNYLNYYSTGPVCIV